MNIHRLDNTIFNAKKLALAEVRCKNVVTNFELYQIQPEDKLYLDNLLKSINLKELFPKLKDSDYNLWQNILLRTLNTDGQTLLLLRDNKPCGALKYKINKLNYAILGRVTWPIEIGKKVEFAGKVLQMGLFHLFMQDKLNMIRTCVTRNSSFGAVAKCMEMGFKSNGGDDYNELMSITRERINQTLEKFRGVINIKKCDSEIVNLEEFRQ